MPPRIARFEVRARLGSGAFGTVYRAYDPQLDRDVALKVARPGMLDHPRAHERFLREARATAQLRHPHIVPVYDAGCDGGHYYIAATYVEGRTLAQVCAEGPMDCRKAARLVRDLAEALDYAHRQGIVHRDVKPANVLLDTQGEAHLTDFGLAHRQEAEKLTHDGDLLGTPAYMAPEQAQGQTGEPLPASDQYSLGAILYELLCGQAPFSGPTPIVLYHTINTDPRAPRRLRPAVPADLETVCLKALAKRPEQRYATCRELAEDLRRWLEGEPIKARRQGPLERAVRWFRKEPVLALAGAGTALALLAAAVVPLAAAARLSAAVREADEARLLAEAKETEAKSRQAEAEHQKAVTTKQRLAAKEEERKAEVESRQAEEAAGRARAEAKDAHDATGELKKRVRELHRYTYVADMSLAQLALDTDKREQAEGVLARYQPGAGADDPRGFEWHYLWHVWFSKARPRIPVEAGVEHLQFDPDCNLLAISHPSAEQKHDLTIERLDVLAGRRRRILFIPGELAFLASARNAPVLSPDGRTVLANSGALTSRLWRIGQAGQFKLDHSHHVTTLAYSADGKVLATAHYEIVKVWSVETGKELVSRTVAGAVRDLALSPDGKILGTAAEGTVRLWDVPSGEHRIRLAASGPVTVVAFAPGGKLLAAAGAAGVRVWNVADGTERSTFLAKTVERLLFAPDGVTLATWGPGAPIRVWDAAVGTERAPLKPQSSRVRFVAFSADSKLLAAGMEGANVLVWDLDRGARGSILPGAVVALAFAPKGRLLATADADGQVNLWDLTDRRPEETLPGTKGTIAALAFSPDGKTLRSCDRMGTVQAWDLVTGKRKDLPTSRLPTALALAVALAPDGGVIAAGRGDGSVTLSEVATGKPWDAFRRPGAAVRAVAVSRGGQVIAAGRADGTVTLWDVPAGRERAPLPGQGTAVTALAFSRDGKALAAGGEDHLVKVWDLDAPKEPARLRGHTGTVQALAWTPDGKTLATSGAGREVKLWDVVTGQELMTLPLRAGEATALAFSPDGRTLAAGSGGDGSVMMWHAASDEEERRAGPLRGEPASPRTGPVASAASPAPRPKEQPAPAPARPAEDAAAARLSAELVNAPAESQDKVLTKLRDSKGTEYTDALAAAIHKLEGPVKDKARDALADRLARFTSATRTEKLKDDDFEVRRAAALAVAMNNDRANVPHVIQLLEDREYTVVQAARATLKFISKEDFGPKPDAGPGEVARAIVEWKEWWKKNGGR